MSVVRDCVGVANTNTYGSQNQCTICPVFVDKLSDCTLWHPRRYQANGECKRGPVHPGEWKDVGVIYMVPEEGLLAKALYGISCIRRKA